MSINPFNYGGDGIPYSDAALTPSCYSSDISRQPSDLGIPHIPVSSYPESMTSQSKNSIDDHLPPIDPLSHIHTRESSGATKPPSIHEEAIRRRLKKKNRQPESSDELSQSSCERQKHHRHRHHSHRAYHSHHPRQRNNRRLSRSRRRTKHFEIPTDVELLSQPLANRVDAVKPIKEDNNTGTITWRRLSQGIRIGRSRKVEPAEKKPSVAIEVKPRRRSKWKFWAKQECNDDDEEQSPTTVKSKDEPEVRDVSESRSSMLELIGEEPLPAQSPTVLKRMPGKD
ncbi:hypothetical protein FGRMN_6082 [Fusarium graminum]|nr:hypothetical protein FGRMN_6082 [Fusarium graminum]